MTDTFSVETKYWHKGEMFDIKGKVVNITHEEIKALEGGVQYTIELLVVEPLIGMETKPRVLTCDSEFRSTCFNCHNPIFDCDDWTSGKGGSEYHAQCWEEKEEVPAKEPEE